jgi:hypothetical protein
MIDQQREPARVARPGDRRELVGECLRVGLVDRIDREHERGLALLATGDSHAEGNDQQQTHDRSFAQMASAR